MKFLKIIVLKILTIFTYFNLIMLIFSLGIWHLAWLFISIEILTGFNIHNDMIPLPNDLGFIIAILIFSAITFINLIYVGIVESFSNTFKYQCLKQDLELEYITREEFNTQYKILLKNYILMRT